MTKIDIKEMSQDQLAAWLDEHGIAPYRAAQIRRWIYLHQADAFERMTNLTKEQRKLLRDHFSIDRLEPIRIEKSRDGSKKYLFKLPDGNLLESVLIPERGHYTLCISSQVGCALGCRFCFTGQGGLTRNLTSGEIIAQVRDIQKSLNDPGHLTNLVLMGMGEPLANYGNVVKAIETLTDNSLGLGFANRRITLSTSGLVDRLADLGRDTEVSLAISLNAADNKTRDWLMPINRKHPIERLLEACRRYPLKPHRRITFEYILLQGVNDSASDAHRLAKLLRPIKAKINLIPFNPFEGCDFRRPDESVIARFLQILLKSNYTAIIRRSKGEDISAACGQLGAHRLKED
jgi:23S rRNA (adenine2503-C2)-methyltransferase